MAKNTKDSSDLDLIQTLSLVATIVQCAHGTSNVQCPWHYLKLSVPGTCNVQWPWHYYSSVPLALSLCSLHSCQHPVNWVLVSPLFLGFQPVLGWSGNFPPDWGSSWSSLSPWEQSGSWLHRLQCPPLLTGQSPPALLWCVMVVCTAWCWPVSHTANVVCLLLFFSWEKLIFVWTVLHQPPAGQHVLADGDVDVSSVEGG